MSGQLSQSCKAHRYEPDINPSYRDLAEHYGVAVLPARARKPRDKAKVEVGVQVVERWSWILAALRNRQFLSLGELNTAIGVLLERLNQRPFKKLPGAAPPSRPSTNPTLDKAANPAPTRHDQGAKRATRNARHQRTQLR